MVHGRTNAGWKAVVLALFAFGFGGCAGAIADGAGPVCTGEHGAARVLVGVHPPDEPVSLPLAHA